jgi:hypothetical protein
MEGKTVASVALSYSLLFFLLQYIYFKGKKSLDVLNSPSSTFPSIPSLLFSSFQTVQKKKKKKRIVERDLINRKLIINGKEIKNKILPTRLYRRRWTNYEGIKNKRGSSSRVRLLCVYLYICIYLCNNAHLVYIDSFFILFGSFQLTSSRRNMIIIIIIISGRGYAGWRTPSCYRRYTQAKGSTHTHTLCNAARLNIEF